LGVLSLRFEVGRCDIFVVLVEGYRVLDVCGQGLIFFERIFLGKCTHLIVSTSFEDAGITHNWLFA
jgi:hypothetical protein